MNPRAELQRQLAAIQSKLNTLNMVPNDTYNLGTLALFASNSNTVKWYYVKTGEELWKSIEDNKVNDLASWILAAIDANIGYFEVYIMTPAAAPIFTSS